MRKSRIGVFCVLIALSILSGCASNPPKGDPLERTNRWVYTFNDRLDRWVLAPVSETYVKVTPKAVRTGVGNFFSNLGYFNVILNDDLQGKWSQGWSDAGRMLTNSTIGVLGIFDVATGWGMPAHKNDFGLTLAHWGAGPGPYLVLPVFGPSSTRDAPGIAVAWVTNPVFWLDPPWEVTAGLTAVNVVDTRARMDADIQLRTKAALDPYVFTRDAYLQYRHGRVHGTAGEAPVDQSLYDEEPGATSEPTTQPTSQPASATSPAS